MNTLRVLSFFPLVCINDRTDGWQTASGVRQNLSQTVNLMSFSCKDCSTVFQFSQVELKKALVWYLMVFNSIRFIAVPRSNFVSTGHGEEGLLSVIF